MTVTVNVSDLCNYIMRRFCLLNLTEKKVLSYLEQNGADTSCETISIDFDKLDAMLYGLDRQQRGC